MPVKASAQILEQGDIFFFYRPRVAVEQVESRGDVQRFYMVLAPEQPKKVYSRAAASRPLDDTAGMPERGDMADADIGRGAELEARRIAEAARETSWAGRGFLRELFLGNFRLDWIHPFPEVETDRSEFRAFFEELERFLEREIDSDAIDAAGEYPPGVIDGLRRLGAFGMKIPLEYGGLGFSQQEYCRALELVGRYDGNLVALLSAHQSIGVPQPVKLFGTEEQKHRFLPRCAKGAISAFALSEPEAGSDPARMSTTATKTPEGDYLLRGEKLWTTNGTFAELVVVIARDPETKKMSCFIVETSAVGVEIAHRCRFMGLRAIENGVLRFHDVRVPADSLVGAEGQGLRIALTTLNTGRLSLPAAVVGQAKRSLAIARRWAAERQQWGVPIGKHEAIAHKVADMAATTLAMESISYLANALAERRGYDIRLEAAAAKEWNSTRGYRIADDLLQLRGGRGYETARSLAERGEEPIPVERLLRDSRINLIFEGTSEIMHLFIAREALDKHLQIAGDLVDPDKSRRDKLAVLPRVVRFYAGWYPTRWIGFGLRPRYAEFGRLARHLRFIERRARRLARSIFHGMMRYGARLERKQALLFRMVDIGLELFAMAATCVRCQALWAAGTADAEHAMELADVFCRGARLRVDAWFDELRNNEDALRYSTAQRVLAGRYAWLETSAAREMDRAAPRPSEGPAPLEPVPAPGARRSKLPPLERRRDAHEEVGAGTTDARR